ncbi:MAG: glycoside hydrolase family 3 protein [Oscillospiraceae bacterium]|nr:glycoside hydrolase family 3 protein [Oscillospiraceae bacterium]
MKRRLICALTAGLLLTACGAETTDEEHSMIDDLMIEEMSAETETDAPETTGTAASLTTEPETFTDTQKQTQQSRTVTTTAASTTQASKKTEGQSVQIIQIIRGEESPATTKTQRTTGTTVSTTGTGKTTSAKRTTSALSTKTAAASTVTTTTAPQPLDIEGRLRAMSLHEKAEQMMISSAADEATAAAAIRRGAGAMCLFAGAFSGKSAAAVQAMTARLQAAAKTPVLIAVDEEGGPVNRVSLNPQLRAAPFRNSRVIFDEGGWDALRGDTAEKADLLLSLGVNVNLGPVCDVPVDPSNYIYSRTFGLNPHETADYADVVVSEMRAHRLGSVLKHFPGYGGSIDTHQFMAYDTRDYSAFTESDFLPFLAGIRAGADAVMVSHNIVNCMDPEHPASLSPEVHRILREELGFTGVIMTDDLGMNAINLYTGGQNAAVAAVLAGNDFVMFADDAASADAIVAAVESGLISEEQINESVLRILRWKQSLGLIE